MISNGMNYLNKVNYTEIGVFNYNDKFSAYFIASWNIWFNYYYEYIIKYYIIKILIHGKLGIYELIMKLRVHN